MLNFSKSQLSKISSSAFHEFCVRARAHLSEYFPEEVQEISDFPTFISDCIEQSKTYDLQSEQEIVMFCHIILSVGSEFENKEECDSIVRTLRNDGVRNDRRLSSAVQMAYLIADSRGG